MKLKHILNLNFNFLSVLCSFIIAISFISSLIQYIDIEEKNDKANQIIKNIKDEQPQTQESVYKNNTNYKELYYNKNIKYDIDIDTNIESFKDFEQLPQSSIVANIEPQGISNENSSDYIEVICQVVEAETHGADHDSKVRIAHVIRNRVNDSRFPNDYYSVCTQSNQFAMRYDIEDVTRQAVNDALNMSDTTNGALWFCTCSSGCWASANATYLFTDSVGHNFWK